MSAILDGLIPLTAGTASLLRIQPHGSPTVHRYRATPAEESSELARQGDAAKTLR
jgi:hypothetical protein